MAEVVGRLSPAKVRLVAPPKPSGGLPVGDFIIEPVRQAQALSVRNPGWRKAWEPLFEGMEASEFEPVSTFPWGDSLFIGPRPEPSG